MYEREQFENLYKKEQRTHLKTPKMLLLHSERHLELGVVGITFRSKELSKSSGRISAAKVFVADGSRMSCQLIAASLRRGHYPTRVVGYATNAIGIREGLKENKADVAVIGVRLEEEAKAGFNVTREILAAHSELKIIMMLDSSKPAMVVEAFRAGARGIFSRDQSSELLCKCIHVVHRGQVWASSEEVQFIIAALGPTPPVEAIRLKGPALLTKREESIVHLVAEGLTNRRISHQLNLSEHTVRNYLFRIFNKVGTSNRLELALYAIDHQQNSLAAMGTPPIGANRPMSSARA